MGEGIAQPAAGAELQRGGLNYLGVYLGDEATLRLNREGLFEKLEGRLAGWEWIRPYLSFKGRVLILNNLTALAVFHHLFCVDPPKGCFYAYRPSWWTFSGTDFTGCRRDCCVY